MRRSGKLLVGGQMAGDWLLRFRSSEIEMLGARRAVARGAGQTLMGGGLLSHPGDVSHPRTPQPHVEQLDLATRRARRSRDSGTVLGLAASQTALQKGPGPAGDRAHRPQTWPVLTRPRPDRSGSGSRFCAAATRRGAPCASCTSSCAVPAPTRWAALALDPQPDPASPRARVGTSAPAQGLRLRALGAPGAHGAVAALSKANTSTPRPASCAWRASSPDSTTTRASA